VTFSEEKKRRDLVVQAIEQLNLALVDDATPSRAELFGDAEIPNYKNWSRAIMNVLLRLGYIEQTGTGSAICFRVLKPLPGDNEAFVQLCVAPFQHAWKKSQLPNFDGGGDEIEPAFEAHTPEPEAPAVDPIQLLLAVPSSVRRIEERMTLIEHRLMDIAEKVEGLHNEWTGKS
jgi:hypothetical protein